MLKKSINDEDEKEDGWKNEQNNKRNFKKKEDKEDTKWIKWKKNEDRRKKNQ